jgi:hypothetical protein
LLATGKKCDPTFHPNLHPNLHPTLFQASNLDINLWEEEDES